GLRGGRVSLIRSGNRSVKTVERKYDEQARVVQVQNRSPYGRKHLGPPEVPGQPSRIRPAPARPAPQGQAVRLRRAAARQAEAEGLLGRYPREAVPRHLRRSQPPQG